MKTIADLNSKWWYRLVKVVYVFLLFSWTIGTAVGVYFLFEPEFDNENSYIACESGKNYRLSENGIFLYSEYMGYYDDKLAKELCTSTETMTAEEYEEKYGEPPKTFLSLDLEKYRLTEYKLISVYTERDWIATIWYMFLGFLGWLLFFELVRRIFYYVVLGKLIPKKNA